VMGAAGGVAGKGVSAVMGKLATTAAGRAVSGAVGKAAGKLRAAVGRAGGAAEDAAAGAEAAEGAAAKGAGGGPRANAAKPSGCNSFVAGTLVKLADGTTKAIEKIKPGDKVLATDPATGRTVAKVVLAAYSGAGYVGLVQVTVDTDGGKGDATGVILATEHHLFWDAEDQTWVRADELTSADTVRTPDGQALRVVSTAAVPSHPTVHDLTVEDFHTFYVLAGTTPVLVHNCGVALGFRNKGLAEFAENKGLKHFLNVSADEWRGHVQSAIADGDTALHVSTKGFSGDFKDLAMRGLGRVKGVAPFATEEEMGWIARAVANGRRTWSSVKFYDDAGDLLSVPEPDWTSFGGALRDFNF
jgi:hypothetical protein